MVDAIIILNCPFSFVKVKIRVSKENQTFYCGIYGQQEDILMNNQCIMGYKVHLNIIHFTPNTVLFSRGTDCITVSMVNDVLDYVLDVIALKSPLSESYNTAKKVLSVLKMRLGNKRLSRPSKKDFKTTVEVLTEIFNANAKSEQQKEYNERCALICKLLIDSFGGDMSWVNQDMNKL